MDDSTITWKCNACGSHFPEPSKCECCGTSLCPNCKAPNLLENKLAMRRMVSHNVTLRKSGASKRQKRKKQIDVAARIAELDQLTK